MRRISILVFALFCSSLVFAQSPSPDLQTQLVDLHAKWFKAFDSGDGATMDRMEMTNLVLVLPSGEIWKKTEPRGTSQPKLDPETKRILHDVSLRKFGDTVILTGTLSSDSKEEKSTMGTMVVFVRSAGQWKIASAEWTTVEGKH